MATYYQNEALITLSIRYKRRLSDNVLVVINCIAIKVTAESNTDSCIGGV